jgi:hypothetical protein
MIELEEGETLNQNVPHPAGRVEGHGGLISLPGATCRCAADVPPMCRRRAAGVAV